MAEGDPPQTPDLAVRAFIGLFVLGAVLHGFDVMKDGMKVAVTWWGIAGGLALFDWYWVKIKGWFGPRFAAKANDVATDFRWWAGALIAVFLISGAFDAIQKVLPLNDHSAPGGTNPNQSIAPPPAPPRLPEQKPPPAKTQLPISMRPQSP